VDEQGQDLPERSVGRLIFRGPSTMSGYFGKPEATAAITLPGGFLDSGDLAYLADGELFITGRHKDLIIKGGRNLVPQEIEELAAQVPGIRRGCVAAFGVTREAQGTEALVIVAETRLTGSEQRARLRAQVVEIVAEHLGLPPDEVVLARPGAVPKTSSGKIRRAATKDFYLSGQLGRPQRISLLSKLRLGSAAAGEVLRVASSRVGRVLYALRLLVTLVPACLVFWLVALCVPSRSGSARLARLGSRLALWFLGCRLEAVGLEALRSGGPFLLAANHTSYADVLVLLALLPLDFAFVAKVEATRWPLVGLFLRRSEHLNVDRGDAQDSLASSERVAATLRAGRSVLIFPEATFTAAAGLRPFRLGVFKIAAELGLPVVPLALQGARRLLRDGTWLPRPGPVRVFVGAPVAASGDEWRAVVDLRDRVAAAIAAECGEPRLDLVTAGSTAAPAS
jgi:1-acyl-sn-glycerol-3-phosphate acyltransferase